MSQVKINFLNWQPDLGEFGHDGLYECDNFIHKPRGYKQIRSATDGAFSTTSPMNAGLNTITSIVKKPFGINNQFVCADIYADTVTTASFRVGVVGEDSSTATTLGTLASIASARIRSFSVSELGQNVILNAQCHASLAAGGFTIVNLSGQISYTVTHA